MLQREIEERLGLPSGSFAKYINENQEDHVLGPTNLPAVVLRAYEEEWLDDWHVFELGLSQCVPSQIEALFKRRHDAYALFEAGMDHMRKGGLPGPKKRGRPRRWDKVREAEARAAYEAWLEDICKLGARVMDVEEWQGWLDVSDPRMTMGQTMEQWGNGLDEVPCPPWLSDRDYWETIYPLNHPLLLDRLILITESDMPYTPHPERLELRPKERSRVSAGASSAVVRTEVIRTECGEEFEMEVVGDDLGEFLAQRAAAWRHAEGIADDLLARLQGRKSGGVDTRD
ncbi:MULTISPECIES: hypothetical protein [Ralstonia]|uniref:Uncharacterized protein n=1 Tax=Ralstonia thomasii TaxID=3058596 RepID=A0ABM9J499_9RALS|nr:MULTISPECIES: hypothetical protein [unclassified Ralstonia]CAJ0781945.1 hypothetical protein LMG18095_00863 [Ralstonia sp. LMG 18095]